MLLFHLKNIIIIQILLTKKEKLLHIVEKSSKYRFQINGMIILLHLILNLNLSNKPFMVSFLKNQMIFQLIIKLILNGLLLCYWHIMEYKIFQKNGNINQNYKMKMVIQLLHYMLKKVLSLQNSGIMIRQFKTI